MLRLGISLLLSLCLVQPSLAGVVWDVTPDRIQDNETVDLNVKFTVTFLDRFSSSFQLYVRDFDEDYDHSYQYSLDHQVLNSSFSWTSWDGECFSPPDVEVKKCDWKLMQFEIEMLDVSDVAYLEFEPRRQFTHSDYYLKKIGFSAPTELEIWDSAKLNTSSPLASVKKKAGEKYSMQCVFTDGRGNKATFSWLVNSTISRSSDADSTQQLGSFKSSKRFGLTDDYSVLESDSLKPGDEGTYQCVADYNPARIGRFQSQVLTLSVLYAPQTDEFNSGSDEVIEAAAGEKVQITWNVMANPDPTSVTWTKQGNTLSPGNEYEILSIESAANPSSFQYSIEFIAEEDTFSVYECKVVNSHGNVVKKFTVKQDARTTEKPTTVQVVQSTETPDTNMTEPTTTEATDWKRLYDEKIQQMNIVMIVMGVIFAILFLSLVVAIIILCIKTRNKNQESSSKTKQTRNEFGGRDNPYYANGANFGQQPGFVDSGDIQLGIRPPTHLPAVPQRPDDDDDDDDDDAEFDNTV